MKKLYFKIKWLFYFMPLWANWLILIGGLTGIIWVWQDCIHTPIIQATAPIEAENAALKDGIRTMKSMMGGKKQFIYEDDLLAPEQAETFLKTVLATNKGLKLIKLLKSEPYELGKKPGASKKKKKKKRGRKRKKKEVAKKNHSDHIAVGPAPFKKLANAKFIRHDFLLDFTGDYKSTLRYIEQLENAKQAIYWESVSATVTQYPTMEIKLNVYTISSEKGWLSA